MQHLFYRNKFEKDNLKKYLLKKFILNIILTSKNF